MYIEGVERKRKKAYKRLPVNIIKTYNSNVQCDSWKLIHKVAKAKVCFLHCVFFQVGDILNEREDYVYTTHAHALAADTRKGRS